MGLFGNLYFFYLIFILGRIDTVSGKNSPPANDKKTENAREEYEFKEMLFLDFVKIS